MFQLSADEWADVVDAVDEHQAAGEESTEYTIDFGERTRSTGLMVLVEIARRDPDATVLDPDTPASFREEAAV